MSRWIGLKTDPTAGGTKLSDLEAAAKIIAPDIFIPATAAQVDAGLAQLDRKAEVRGRRGDSVPVSFASNPSLTLETHGYAEVVNRILSRALGGTISSTGTAPAAIVSSYEPLQTGNLPPLIVWLLREEQLDRMTGAIVGETTLTFPIDGESTIAATLHGLFHDAQNSTSPKEPGGAAAEAYPTPDYKNDLYAYMLRDAVAFNGPSGATEIANLAGFSLTFNNGMIEDFRSRYQPGKNIQSTTIDSVLHKLWFPARHKIGPQVISGKIDLSNVDAVAEAKHLFTHSEKLVFTVEGGPLATTPASTELLKITLYSHALTGGGAEPLVREGDQVASFDFTAYIDVTTNKDIKVESTNKAVIA